MALNEFHQRPLVEFDFEAKLKNRPRTIWQQILRSVHGRTVIACANSFAGIDEALKTVRLFDDEEE